MPRSGEIPDEIRESGRHPVDFGITGVYYVSVETRGREPGGETMTTTKLTSDLIGCEVEFNHPKTSRRTIGRVLNIFKNGKVQVRPHYTRNGDTLTLFGFDGQRGFTAPVVNVRFERCEVRESN